MNPDISDITSQTLFFPIELFKPNKSKTTNYTQRQQQLQRQQLQRQQLQRQQLQRQQLQRQQQQIKRQSPLAIQNSNTNIRPLPPNYNPLKMTFL